MSINLTLINAALEKFDKARAKYEQAYRDEDVPGIKQAALELQFCTIQLAGLLIWKDIEPEE